MSVKAKAAGDNEELRRRAEERAREGLVGAREEEEALSHEEARKALHELRVHQIELEMQNEELRRSHAELEAARARYLDLYDLAPVGYLSLNESGFILEANLTAATLLSQPRSSLVGQPISRFIDKEDQDSYYLYRKALFEERKPNSWELRMRKKDGTAFWAGLEAIATESLGGEGLARLALFDITERRRVEEALQRAFQENKVLLAELQHRVKNSFNVITGMIGLTAGPEALPEVKAALEDLTARVKSVSTLYSLLYSSGSFAELRLGDYCAKIAVPLIRMAKKLELDTEFEDIVVPTTMAAPLGLILTELLVNAVKYAFPGGRPGRIKVSIQKSARGALLAVEDDGVGFPEDCEAGGKAKMGLNLVRALSAQIDGSFRIEPSHGTRCVVEFPLPRGDAP